MSYQSTVQQGPTGKRPPHAGIEDCKRGRHEWRYIGWNAVDKTDVYRCDCCSIEDSD